MAAGAATDRHVPRVGRVQGNPKLVTDLFVRPPIVWVIEGAPRSILGQGGLQLVQYSAHLVVDVKVVQRLHQGVWGR